MTRLSKATPTSDKALTGLEARVHADEHLSLKLWLRLLATSTDIETEIRKRLRQQFDTTLARFDYLAQLYRHPEGLRMNELSSNLMVTGGNVTGLTDQLEKAGLVKRSAQSSDRRAYLVSLTAKGRESFEAMAKVHEGWVLELLGGLSASQQSDLYSALGNAREHLSRLLRPEK